MQSPATAVQTLNRLKQEARKLRDHVYELGWFMRGSVSASEIWDMSAEERRSLNHVISENVKRSQKSQMPLI